MSGKHCSYGHVAGTIKIVAKIRENTVCGNVILEFSIYANIHNDRIANLGLLHKYNRVLLFKIIWDHRGSVLPLSTQVCGFKPCRSRQDFSGQKNPQHAFLRKGSKAMGPMSQICGT